MPIPVKDRPWTTLQRVCPTKDGAIALGLHRMPDNVGNRAVVLRLSREGKSISTARPLAVESPAVCWNLIVTGPTSALAMVANRTESRTTQPNGVIHANRKDTPNWFSIDWQDRLQAKRLGRWDDVNMMVATQVARFGRQTVWTGSEMTADYTQWGDFRLVIGDGRDKRMPTAVHANIPCAEVSQPVKAGDDVFVLLTVDWKQLELWSFDKQWTPTFVATVDTPRKTPTRNVGQLARPHAFLQKDALILMWVSYTDPYKGGRWQGIPLACRYVPKTRELTKPVRIAEDDQVVSPTLWATDLGESKFVLWEHRPKRGGGGTRVVRFAELEELPKPPVKLTKDLPLFALDADGPILQQYYGTKTGGWACSDPLPDL